MIPQLKDERPEYRALPTLKMFHESPADIRCCVGPVGSGKTTAAAWEICYYLPMFLKEKHGLSSTRWAVVRNTYPELRDTTMRTVFDWFDWGNHRVQDNIYLLDYGNLGVEVEILFRSCDNPKDVAKFKSLEITGYWIDESIEVAEEVKRMLKNRIGRYPAKCPRRFGIETTNPPDIEHPTYWSFDWKTEVPGPLTVKQPLANHEGFWQPPRENEPNLPPAYYDNLIDDYRDSPDWLEMYVEGKPGTILKGKQVYNKFKQSYHVAQQPLVWAKGDLWRGWDNSGNSPACVVVQEPQAGQYQVLKEFHSDKMGISDFAEMVTAQCNLSFPNASYQDFGDPAGEARYSKRSGGFTSNAEIMRETCKVNVQASDNNWDARREAVERTLGRIEGLLIDPGCIRLINGFLGGYHYPEIGNTGMFKDQPEKNKYSHVHDALQYVMLKMRHSSDYHQRKDVYETYRAEHVARRDAEYL